MSFTKIKFYDEKKLVVTNILDAAVKTLDYDQKDYIKTKAQLMRVIEKPGYEGLGLAEIVSVTNKLIAKVANHSGYIIVNAGKETPRDNGLLQELNLTAAVKQDDAISAEKSESLEKKAIEFEKMGKKKLLQLIKLLPPLISNKELQNYSLQIEALKHAPATGAISPRTTGDVERNVVEKAVQSYVIEFDQLVLDQPTSFLEPVEMASGKAKKIDVSDKLRKQLNKVETLAEFLSIRDLVNRHIDKEVREVVVKEGWGSLFFWKKT